MSSPTRRQALVARTLEAVYDHHGRDAALLPPEGGAGDPRGVVAIFNVTDVVQGLDGAAIDTKLKGFTAKLRVSDVEGLEIRAGHRLVLEEPFHGHERFVVDSRPRAYGREGAQLVVGLSAASDPVDPA